MVALRRSMLTVGCAVAVAAPAPASANAAPATLRLPSTTTVEDLAEAPDGTLRVLTQTWSVRTSGTPVHTYRLGDAGPIGSATKVSRGRLRFSGAFAPDGAVVLLREATTERGGRNLPDVYTVKDGVGSAPVRIASARTSLTTPRVGPTGAVLVRASQDSRRRYRSGYLFRPAGAPAFGRFTTVGSTPAAYQRRDPGGDGADATYAYAFAPDGGAAVLSLPDSAAVDAPYVRRISAAGTLGPRIDLGIGAHHVSGGELSFGPTGKLTVVVAALRRGTDHAVGAGSAFVSTLAPGATSAPAPQRLAEADAVTAYTDLLSIDHGPGDRVVVAVGVMDGDVAARVRTFESTGGEAFREAAPVIAVTSPRDIHVHAREDGGTSVLWSQISADGSVDDGAYLVTRSAAEPAFPAPRMVTRRLRSDSLLGVGFRNLDALLWLSGNRLAVAYGDYQSADASTIVELLPT